MILRSLIVEATPYEYLAQPKIQKIIPNDPPSLCASAKNQVLWAIVLAFTKLPHVGAPVSS